MRKTRASETITDNILVIDPSHQGETGLYLNGTCYSIKENNPWNMFERLKEFIKLAKVVIIEVGRKLFQGCECNIRIMNFIKAVITYARELNKKVLVINMDYNFYKYDYWKKLFN